MKSSGRANRRGAHWPGFPVSLGWFSSKRRFFIRMEVHSGGPWPGWGVLQILPETPVGYTGGLLPGGLLGKGSTLSAPPASMWPKLGRLRPAPETPSPQV